MINHTLSLIAGLSTIALGGSWALNSSAPPAAPDNIRTHCERWNDAAVANDAIAARSQAHLVAFVSGRSDPGRECASRGVAITLMPVRD